MTPSPAPALPQDASSPPPPPPSPLLRGELAEGSGGWLPVSQMAAAAHTAKKRRPEEEAEEEMHLAFRGAANALSQVYTQAVAHQKASFLVGERRSMECVYRWISSQHEEAPEVSVADVLAYLQNEIERRAEDMSGSSQHPSPQPAYDFPSAIVQSNAFSFGNVAAALNCRLDQTDQTRSADIQMLSPALRSKISTQIIWFNVPDMAPLTPCKMEMELGTTFLLKTRTPCIARALR